jgi:hypothetical protein
VVPNKLFHFLQGLSQLYLVSFIQLKSSLKNILIFPVLQALKLDTHLISILGKILSILLI